MRLAAACLSKKDRPSIDEVVDIIAEMALAFTCSPTCRFITVGFAVLPSLFVAPIVKRMLKSFAVYFNIQQCRHTS